MKGPFRDILVFSLDAAVYGVDAALVRETLWLPELSPAEEAPPGVMGLFNLRGEIVPVVDLALCLGRGVHSCRVSDQVIVLALESGPVGMVVSEVRDFTSLPADTLLPLPQYEIGQPTALAVAGFQLENELATLLDAHSLLRSAEQATAAARELPCEGEAGGEQALLRSRARSLQEPVAVVEQGDLALAVVELGGQYFGIDLKAVREFCHVPNVSPIPCCPPHVAGVFNLRGHLVTLLEIASALNLPVPGAPRPKAVIGYLGEEAVGVAVDEVIDVFNPEERELRPVPPALIQEHGLEVRAITSLAGRMVAVLDLRALLQLDQWIVDETIA